MQSKPVCTTQGWLVPATSTLGVFGQGGYPPERTKTQLGRGASFAGGSSPSAASAGTSSGGASPDPQAGLLHIRYENRHIRFPVIQILYIRALREAPRPLLPLLLPPRAVPRLVKGVGVRMLLFSGEMACAQPQRKCFLAKSKGTPVRFSSIFGRDAIYAEELLNPPRFLQGLLVGAGLYRKGFGFGGSVGTFGRDAIDVKEPLNPPRFRQGLSAVAGLYRKGVDFGGSVGTFGRDAIDVKEPFGHFARRREVVEDESLKE